MPWPSSWKFLGVTSTKPVNDEPSFLLPIHVETEAKQVTNFNNCFRSSLFQARRLEAKLLYSTIFPSLPATFTTQDCEFSIFVPEIVQFIDFVTSVLFLVSAYLFQKIVAQGHIVLFFKELWKTSHSEFIINVLKVGRSIWESSKIHMQNLGSAIWRSCHLKSKKLEWRIRFKGIKVTNADCYRFRFSRWSIFPYMESSFQAWSNREHTLQSGNPKLQYRVE